MGCFGSKPATEQQSRHRRGSANASKIDKLIRPKWKADPPITASELERKRAEFWDTQPAYGGSKEIWDALRAVVTGGDDDLLILDAAGCRVVNNDLSKVYDERGVEYNLPDFVVSAPTNLVSEHQPQESIAATP